MVHLTRRQFGLGASAVAAAATLPLSSTMSSSIARARAAPTHAIAALDPELGRLARDVVRRARFFGFLDAKYFEDERYASRWVNNLWPLIQKADLVYGSIEKPQTHEEREVWSWLETIVPSEIAMARTPLDIIPGLSRRGRWLEAMFQEAQMRRAEARMAFSWISYNAWRNPTRKHVGITRAYQNSQDAVRIAADRIRMRVPTETRGDLLLLRRAWEVRLYRPKCFEVKCKPQVRKRHRAAGISAERSEPTVPGGERQFRFVLPDVRRSGRPGIGAAYRSALRVNEPGDEMPWWR